MTFPIPFKYQNNPKSNYYTIDYTDQYGRAIRNMISKPIYTCQESPAMQDYIKGIELWLESFK